MALVDGSGNPIAKAPGTSVLQTVTDSDPLVEVQEDVYRIKAWDGVNYSRGSERQLAFRQGQQIRQSEWDREFVAPEFSSIDPATGSTAGGTAVTIMGTNFSQDAAVTVGGTAATSVTVVSSAEITATTPAGTAGAQDVVVTTAGGSATGTGAFTYA